MKQRNLLFAIAAFAAAQMLFSCSPSTNDGFAKRKYFDYKWDRKEYVKAEVEKDTPAREALSSNETEIATTDPSAAEAPAAEMELVALPAERPVQAVSAPAEEQAPAPAVDPGSPVMGAKEGGMGFAEKMLVRKMERIAEKKQKKDSQRVETIVLVILAILIPPLAVYLAKGLGTEFWISLILTLLFFLPGVIYSLIVVLT